MSKNFYMEGYEKKGKEKELKERMLRDFKKEIENILEDIYVEIRKLSKKLDEMNQR